LGYFNLFCCYYCYKFGDVILWDEKFEWISDAGVEIVMMDCFDLEGGVGEFFSLWDFLVVIFYDMVYIRIIVINTNIIVIINNIAIISLFFFFFTLPLLSALFSTFSTLYFFLIHSNHNFDFLFFYVLFYLILN
jgi:hypothetical protein